MTPRQGNDGRGTETLAGSPDVAEDAVDAPEGWRHLSIHARHQHAVRPVRLWRPGLSGAFVSDWFAVRGGEHVEKIAHIKLAHLGF